MLALLKKLREKVVIGTVGGSDLPKITEQYVSCSDASLLRAHTWSLCRLAASGQDNSEHARRSLPCMCSLTARTSSSGRL